MRLSPIAITCLIINLTGGLSAEPTLAKSQQIAVQDSKVLDQIEHAVYSAVRKSCDRIEVLNARSEMTVVLVNCSNNSIQSRAGEARWIAGVVTDAIAGKEGLRNVSALHVDYVTCDKSGKYLRQIDGIEFFKDRYGKFQLHMT